MSPAWSKYPSCLSDQLFPTLNPSLSCLRGSIPPRLWTDVIIQRCRAVSLICDLAPTARVGLGNRRTRGL